MSRFTVPTSTSVIERTLRAADDFRTSRQLQLETMLDVNHVSAALYHLRKYKAVDCLEENGTLWWFATPDTDTRTRVVDERHPEAKARKSRRIRVKEQRS